MVLEDDLLGMQGPWDHRGYSDFASLLRGDDAVALESGLSALQAPLPPKPEVVWDHRTGHRRWQVKPDSVSKSSLEMCASSTASTASGGGGGGGQVGGGTTGGVTIGGSSSSSSSSSALGASRPSTVSGAPPSCATKASGRSSKAAAEEEAPPMTPPPPREEKLNITDLLSGIELGPPGPAGLRPPPGPGEYAPRRLWAKPRAIKASKVEHFVPDTTDETRREIAVKIMRTCRALLGMIDLSTATTTAEKAASLQDIFDSKLGIRGTAKQKLFEDMKMLQYSEREVLEHLLTREKLKAQTKRWKKLQNDCDLDLEGVDRRMQLQARHTNKILTNATGGTGTDELGGKLFHLQLKHREMAALAALGTHKVGHFHKFCQFKGKLAQRRVQASSALNNSGQLTTLREEEDEDAIELPSRKRRTQYDEVMRLQLELEVATDEKRKRHQEKQHESQWQKEAERSAFQEEQAAKSTEEKMLDHAARVQQALALPTDQSVNAERLVNFIHNGEASLKKQLSELAELKNTLQGSESTLVEEIRDVCQKEVTAMVESGDISEDLVLQVTQDPETTQAVIKPLQHRRNRLVLMRDILVKDVGDKGFRFAQQVDERISKLPISEIIANNWTKPMATDFKEKYVAATKATPGGRAHGLTELLDTATAGMKTELLARQQKDFEALLQVEAGSNLGFDGEVHGNCTVVKAIAETGLLAAYNKANPEDPIMPEDRIVSTSLASMLTPFGKGMVRRNLTLQHTAALEVMVERHGKDVLAEVEHQQMLNSAREERLKEREELHKDEAPVLGATRRRGAERRTGANWEETRPSEEDQAEEKERAKAKQMEEVAEGMRIEEQLQAQAREAEAFAREAVARTNALRAQVGDLLRMCDGLLEDLTGTYKEMRKWSHKDDAEALRISIKESKDALARLKGILSQSSEDGATLMAIAELETLIKSLLDKVEAATKAPNFGQATLDMELNEEQADSLMSARISMALSKSRQGSGRTTKMSWPEHGEDLIAQLEDPNESEEDEGSEKDDEEEGDGEQVEDLRKQLEDMQNELGVNEETEKVIMEMLDKADPDAEEEDEDPEAVAARKAAKFMNAFRMRMMTMMPRKLRRRVKPHGPARPRAWKVGAKVIAPRRGNLSAATVARDLEDSRLLLDWVDSDPTDREKHEGQIRSDFEKGEQVQALRDGVWHKATITAQKGRDRYEVEWKDGAEQDRVVPLSDMWCAELEEFLSQALDKTQKELAFFRQRESDARKGLKQVLDMKTAGSLVKSLNPMSKVVRGSVTARKLGSGIFQNLTSTTSPQTPAAGTLTRANSLAGGLLGPVSSDGNLDGLTVTPLQDNAQSELLAELEKAAGVTGVGAAALASPKDRYKAQVAAKKQIAEVQKLLQSRMKVLMATLPHEEAAKLKLQRRATFNSGKANAVITAGADGNAEEKALADKLKQLNKLMGFWSRRIVTAKEAQLVDEVEVPAPGEHVSQEAPANLHLDESTLTRFLPPEEDHNMLSPQVQGHRKSRAFTTPRKTISNFQAPFGSPTFNSADPGPEPLPPHLRKSVAVGLTHIDPVGLGVASVMPPTPKNQLESPTRKSVMTTDFMFGAQEGRSVGAPSPSNFRTGGMPLRKAKRGTTLLPSSAQGVSGPLLGAGDQGGAAADGGGKLLFCGNAEEPAPKTERPAGPQEEVVLQFVAEVLGLAGLPVTQDSKLAALGALLEAHEQNAVKGELKEAFDLPEGMRQPILATLARGKVTAKHSPIAALLENQRRAYQVRGVLAGMVKRIQYLIEYFQAAGVPTYSSGDQRRSQELKSPPTGTVTSPDGEPTEVAARLRRKPSLRQPKQPRNLPLASRRSVVAPGTLSERRKVSISIDQPPSTAGSVEGHAVWMSTDSTGSASRPLLPHDVDHAIGTPHVAPETPALREDSEEECLGERGPEQKRGEKDGQQQQQPNPQRVLQEQQHQHQEEGALEPLGDPDPIQNVATPDVASNSDAFTSPREGRKSGASTRSTLKFSTGFEVVGNSDGEDADPETRGKSSRPSRSRSPPPTGLPNGPAAPNPKQRASVGQLALVNPTLRGEAKPEFEVGGQPLSADHPELWENLNENQARGRLELRKSASNMRLQDRSPPPEPTGRRSRSTSPAPALVMPEVKLAGAPVAPAPPIQHGSLGHVVRGRSALEASARHDINEDAGWLLARLNAVGAQTAAIASGKHSALGSLSSAVKAAAAWKSAAAAKKDVVPQFKEIKPVDAQPPRRLQEPKRTAQPMVAYSSATPARGSGPRKDSPSEPMRQLSDGWKASKAYRDLDKERYATAEEVRRQTDNVKRRRTQLMREVQSDSEGFKKGRMALDYMWDVPEGEDPLSPSSSASSAEGSPPPPQVLKELQEQRARETRDQLHEILMRDASHRERPKMNLSRWLKKKGIVEEEGDGADGMHNEDALHHHHRGKLVRTHHHHHGPEQSPDDLELNGHGAPNGGHSRRHLVQQRTEDVEAVAVAAQMSAFGKVPAMAALAAAAVSALKPGHEPAQQPAQAMAGGPGQMPEMFQQHQRHMSPVGSHSPQLRHGHLQRGASPTGLEREVRTGLGVGAGGSGSPSARGRPAARDDGNRRRQRLHARGRSPDGELQDSHSDWKHSDLLSAQAQLAALTGHPRPEATPVQLQETSISKVSPTGRLPLTRSRSPPRSPPREHRRGDTRDNANGPREFVGLDGFGLVGSGFSPGRSQPRRAQSVPGSGRVLSSTLGQSSLGFFGSQKQPLQASAPASQSPAPSKTRGRAAPVFTLELDTDNINRPAPIGFRGAQLNRQRKASSLEGKRRARSLDEARVRLRGASVEPSRSPPRKATVFSVQLPSKQVDGSLEEVHSWLKDNLMLFNRRGGPGGAGPGQFLGNPGPVGAGEGGQDPPPSNIPLSMARFPSKRLGYRGSDWDLRRASKEGESTAPRPSRLGASDAPGPRFALDTRLLGPAWSALPKTVKSMGPTNSLDALSSALKNYLEDFSCPSLEAALAPAEDRLLPRRGLARLEPLTGEGLPKSAWGAGPSSERSADPGKPQPPTFGNRGQPPAPPATSALVPPPPPLSARGVPPGPPGHLQQMQTPRAPMNQQSAQQQQPSKGGPYPPIQLDLAGSAILRKQGAKATSGKPPPLAPGIGNSKDEPILISSSSGRLFVPAGQWSKLAKQSSSGRVEDERKELQIVANSSSKSKNAPVVPLLHLPAGGKSNADSKLPALDGQKDEGQHDTNATPRRSPSPWHRDVLGHSARMNKDAQRWAKHIEKRLGPEAMGGWRAQASSAR